MIPNTFETREGWLHRLIGELRPLFGEHGRVIPSNIRVAPGFAGGRRVLGRCYPTIASKDGSFEIFVSPLLEDPMRVAGVLAHELIHAIVGTKVGHRAPFARLALAIGLTGPMEATGESEAFKRALAPILEMLGPYPHAELDPWKRLIGCESPDGVEVPTVCKKQGTRLLKVMCRCGYTVRVTLKWLDKAGPPLCPKLGHGAMARQP